MRSLRLLGFAILLVVGASPRADDKPAQPNPELEYDLKALAEARVGTDGPALLEFLRQRSLPDDERARIPALVRKLGDDDFGAREQAAALLVKAGRAAVPYLRPALRDRDLEIARGARDCLDRIESASDLALAAAVVRVISDRQPDGADAVLIAYLPSVADDFLEDTIHTATEKLGQRDGKPSAVVSAALKDKEPSRRAAAAHVLARHCPAERPKVVKLLTDEDARVRFHAATALARAGEKKAVPVLVALLVDAPEEQAWRVEDLLLRIAGDKAPTLALDVTSAKVREKCRDAWADWWKNNEEKADLASLDKETPSLGLRVVCELQGAKGGGRVVAFGADKKVRWEFDTEINGPIDVQLLPNGHVLAAEINSRKVTERDRQGKIVFEKMFQVSPMTCVRLPNGNTFIATYTEVLEVDRKGETVYSHQRPGSIYCAQKLRNGNILTLDNQGNIFELTTEGKEVRKVAAGDTSNWGGVEIQPNGNFVVARCGQHEVVEIDPTGKVVWRLGPDKIQWPTWAGRTSNGHTLVACAHSGIIAEFDRGGKELWRMDLQGRPCRLRRY
jgi:hypothetical protein